MGAWAAIVADVDSIMLSTYGIPVTYQPAAGNPVTIQATRESKDPIEAEQYAAFERIWTLQSQFPNSILPQRGDFVTLGSDQYVVADVKPDDREPLSQSVFLSLNRRNPRP